MIYPSRRTILSAAAIAPLALVIGVLVPQFWFFGLVLIAFLLGLCAVDAVIGPASRHVQLVCDTPGAASVGAELAAEVHLGFSAAGPARAEIALGSNALLQLIGQTRRQAEVEDGVGSAAFDFRALRRGKALIDEAWVRWRAPLGLLWKQKRLRLDREILITPDIRPVREKAAELMHRDAMHGLVAQLQVGEGAEFEALTEYRAGMDRRSIDWKQSARHTALIAKEYRTERNNNIVMAVDSGRAMCEPLEEVPRIDRAVSAALLAAYVALRGGDRVGLFGFDSHPRVSSNILGGPKAFGTLQRVAAEIDYSSRETNYTLGLATLAAGLSRRSLVVVFTEFADTISAELMLSSLGPLLKRHLVLFVVMRDQELEDFAAAVPHEANDVVRAATAASLLRQRSLVIRRLRHLGAHVVEAPHHLVGPALVGAYVDFKRRSLI